MVFPGTDAGAIRCVAVAIALMYMVLLASTHPASSQQTGHFFVANVLPPDDFLALRSQPSATTGQRIDTMPNGVLLDVLERREDGWWRVRMLTTGQEGWALSGQGNRQWILCCRVEPQMQTSSDPELFSTPSGNIHCMASSFEEIVLRCDLNEIANRPLAPENCPLSWGDAYQITATATRGVIFCHGDTVGQDNTHVLQYGQVWRGLGFSCQSAATGLTCFNAAGHGFTLSRAVQRVF